MKDDIIDRHNRKINRKPKSRKNSAFNKLPLLLMLLLMVGVIASAYAGLNMNNNDVASDSNDETSELLQFFQDKNISVSASPEQEDQEGCAETLYGDAYRENPESFKKFTEIAGKDMVLEKEEFDAYYGEDNPYFANQSVILYDDFVKFYRGQ